MKMSEGVEWSIHCCALLAALPESAALSARKLAAFFDLPAHYLAKHLQNLSLAGLVATTKGPGGGYRLAKPAAAISLLDIVTAVDSDTPVFQCTEIRRRGPTAARPACYKRRCGIARAMAKAEQAWRRALAEVSLADIQEMGAKETPKEQLEKSIRWLESNI